MDRSKQNDSSRVLVNKINQKIDYLTAIRNSIVSGDILRVYKLLDSTRFNKYVNKYQHADSNVFLSVMTKPIQSEIADFLAPELIHYIDNQMPFFHFEEISLGVYAVFIGDWWQHRQIGLLDVIRAEFIFDGFKLDQIKETFELENEESVNDIDIEDAKKQIKAYKEKDLHGHAKQLEEKLISLQKESKIIQLEVNEIKNHFADFADFAEKTGNLYQEYLNGMANVDVAN